jgi:hypothetical protein
VRYHPPECRECGAKAEDGIPISARGLCPPCAAARWEASIENSRHPGEKDLRKWVIRMIRGHRRALVMLEERAREMGLQSEEIGA